jgi:predicted metal-dependent hydrolase
MDAAARDRLMIVGRDAFERGAFFEAHEVWEQVWSAAEDPERRWIQGMIQIAAALHKLAHDRPAACRRLLAKALPKLADAPAERFGCALGTLREAAAAMARALEAGAAATEARLPITPRRG